MAWTFPMFKNESPGARAAHSCDIVGNSLYIFGGWNGKKALNDLHVLDTEEMQWVEPEATGRIPACRNNHTTAVVGSKVYVHGGHDGTQWLSDLYVLDTSTLIWAKPNISGTAPSARACHTMSRIGRKLYLFGGYDGFKCFNDIDVLDLDTMTWLQPYVEGQVPLARNAHTMTVVGTRLLLFGGHSGNKHLKDLHVLDTETMTWTEPEMTGTPPKGLRGHTANLIGEKIYLFGGYDGRGRSNDLYILNAESLLWTHPMEGERSPAGRQRHTACSVGNKFLYIFGGFDGNKWLNDIYILDVGRLEASEIQGEAVTTLLTNLKKLINNPLFSDVKFLIEGRELHAHKAILVSQCHHFHAMFLSGMKETHQSEIVIQDWGYSPYLNMMEFLYTGNISNFTQGYAMELIGLADAYGIEGLKKLCENTLVHNVTLENVCQTLVIAHRFSAIELKKFCMAYIVKHFDLINNTPAFESLEEVPNLLIEITRAVFAKRDF